MRTRDGKFRKGHKIGAWKPIGTEVKTSRGDIFVKVIDCGEYKKDWKRKSRYVWEKEHGEIPKGHVVIFVDGDKNNYSIENLRLVKKGVASQLNFMRWDYRDAELTLAIIQTIELKLLKKAKNSHCRKQ